MFFIIAIDYPAADVRAAVDVKDLEEVLMVDEVILTPSWERI
jgi:hypothetical protein